MEIGVKLFSNTEGSEGPDMVLTVAKHILSKKWATLTPGKLVKDIKSWREQEPKTQELCLQKLASFGWIKEVNVVREPGNKARTPAAKYLVNPRVHEDFKKKAKEFSKAFKEIGNVFRKK